MSTIRIWLKASRLQSQSYIFLPILVGQAFFVFQGHSLNWRIFIILLLFGLFDQLYIVYANDYADVETDRLNTTFNIFSGGSRVLADRELVPAQLKAAAIVMSVSCLICGLLLSLLYNRLLTLPIVVAALGLLWLYSYAPVRLSYRGGGELLQMLGVGLVLPVFGYYAQSGKVAGFPWLLLISILPTQLACAMATSLADEPSDRQSGKKTMTVLLGGRTTKFLILFLNVSSIAVFPFVGWLSFDNSMVYKILLLPVLAVLGQIFFINSVPGTSRLTVFTSLSVLTTLSLMGGMAIALLSNEV